MKPTTEICIAIKHIGDQNDNQIMYFEGKVSRCILDLTSHVLARSMATRFDLVICRNRKDAENAMEEKINGNAKLKNSQLKTDLLDELQKMMQIDEIEGD